MAYTDIDKPSDYFNTVTYTGNGTARNITTGLTTTDWVWIKRRDGTANHRLTDVVRGATNMLSSNNTNATQTHAQTVTAFGTNTFSLGTDSGGYDVNTNSQTYASWNWSAGGSASSNTDGSITSTVSANTTAGFSIVSYTGTGANATVGHGLSAVPSVIIIKNRDEGTGYNWRVYHHKNTSAPETDRLNLNDTNATHDDISYWNDTAPTSSVVSIGTDSSLNKSGDAHIAYCFAEKKGFSKFSSYVGNGSSDGTFCFTGMKPSFVMCKRSSGTGNWQMFDSKREGYNVDNDGLQANLSNAEATDDDLDILSNGFKLRGSGNDLNGSGETYIYMAFAENPFVTSTGVPATAR